MLEFIMKYWVEAAFGLILSALLAGYKHLKKGINDRSEENKAMKKAVLAILRQNLYDAYNKWSEKGYCPIYALEVCTGIYEQYHILGGNDIGSELYDRLKELPTRAKGDNKGKQTCDDEECEEYSDNKFLKEV